MSGWHIIKTKSIFCQMRAAERADTEVEILVENITSQSHDEVTMTKTLIMQTLVPLSRAAQTVIKSAAQLGSRLFFVKTEILA
jgi:hypothetical protein